MRLLTESLYASWRPEFPFVTMANVGVYVALNRAVVVPDVLVATHVQPVQDLLDPEHAAYFSWILDARKPEVVIEIVSNTKGGELDSKMRNYAHMKVEWYAVFDPAHYLTEESLTIFRRTGEKYSLHSQRSLGEIGLGLTLWEGEFEGVTCTWLRWCDQNGTRIPTGQERAAVLAAKLRELGVDPDTVT